MKILFVNLPYYGHIIPTIGLVQELVKAGHNVTYLLPYDWEGMIKESGAIFYGYENHKKLNQQIRNAFFAAEQIIDTFDLVIYEQFFFVGKHLAEKHKKPSIRIFTAPATNKDIMKKYISSGGPLGIFKSKWICNAWTNDVVKNMGIVLKTNNWLDEIVYNIPDINLVYSTKEFQPFSDTFPNEQFFFIGASVYDRKEKDVLIKNSDIPIIYISLGTVIHGATVFFKKCIKAFSGKNVSVIMSVGKTFNIKRLGEIPDNFIVVNAAPQIRVLKQANVFITHGGMNSVSEAMTFGVPMIVIPFSADQPTNAEQIEKLGIGVRLDYSDLTIQSLTDTVFFVLNDEQIKQNITFMREKIECSLGNNGAVRIIEKYYRQCVNGDGS